MPEGPEVRTMVEDMHAALGERLLSVEWKDPGRYRGKEEKSGIPILQGLVGKVHLSQVDLHGKLMWLEFYDRQEGHRWLFTSTLGMTGNWSWRERSHCMFELHLSESSLFFNDTRHFGTFLHITPEGLKKKVAALGHDVLKDVVEDRDRREVWSSFFMRAKKKTVVEALMDQSICSGVGNYIKSESLYRAAISPHRVVESLSLDEMDLLYRSLWDIMAESYAMRGCSLRDYRDVANNEGFFQDHLKVYGKKKDPFGREVMKEKTADGRTTWYCREVQK